MNDLNYIQEDPNIIREKTNWDNLINFYNRISLKLLFFYCCLFCILYLYFNRKIIITIIIFLIIFTITSLYNNKLVDNVEYKKQLNYPKSRYIEENKELTDFLYSIQEFYNYNPQLYIELVSSIDNVLSIYDYININNALAGSLYNSIEKQKFIALDCLQSIVILIPDDRKVIEKLNKSIKILEEILNRYLYDVYKINNNYIKINGYNIETKLININDNIPYNETFNSSLIKN
jgi:hypothetical protein